MHLAAGFCQQKGKGKNAENFLKEVVTRKAFSSKAEKGFGSYPDHEVAIYVKYLCIFLCMKKLI